MPQHLRYPDKQRCLAVLSGQSTDQLLLLGELQIGFGIFHRFFGEDDGQLLLKIASIQTGEWRRCLQKGDNLASSLLHLRQQLHIHGTGVHPLKQLVQHDIAELNAQIANLENVYAAKADITELSAQIATIDNLTAKKADVEQLYACLLYTSRCV